MCTPSGNVVGLQWLMLEIATECKALLDYYFVKSKECCFPFYKNGILMYSQIASISSTSQLSSSNNKDFNLIYTFILNQLKPFLYICFRLGGWTYANPFSNISEGGQRRLWLTSDKLVHSWQSLDVSDKLFTSWCVITGVYLDKLKP